MCCCVQVYELVGLAELYYAGSHGMDIMFPVQETSSLHQNTYIRSTDKQVFIIFSSNFIFLKYPSSKFLLIFQGKEVNLFQPASEFIPMIDEVRDQNSNFKFKQTFIFY